jgi:hypothetical protein
MKLKYVLLIFIFSFIIKFAFSQNNLNGNWFKEENGTEEHLGKYNLSYTLTINGENYMYYENRISQYAMHWDYCEIGRIIITNDEIQLFPEAHRGQLSSWHKSGIEDIVKYKYIVKGSELTLIYNNKNTKYMKTSEIKQEQLLVYFGSMTGTQILNIKLVVGDFYNAYYMYYRNGTYGEPIKIWGKIENNILILYEEDFDFNDRAVFTFPNFDPNANFLHGIWQDLRPGHTINKYDLNLSK